MAKRKPTLADYVEAAERRDAPRAQARVNGRRGSWGVWFLLIVLAFLLVAGALAFLRMKKLI